MLPHYMVKDNEGRMRRERWSSQSANFALQQFVREEEIKLNAQDCDKASAAGIEHMVIKTRFGAELATSTIGPTGDYEVEPVAARIKHSGLDSKKAVGARWRAFCSEPRDEQEVLAAMFTAANDDEAAEGTLSAPPIAMIPISDVTTNRRKPGRPRKEILRAG